MKNLKLFYNFSRINYWHNIAKLKGRLVRKGQECRHLFILFDSVNFFPCRKDNSQKKTC